MIIHCSIALMSCLYFSFQSYTFATLFLGFLIGAVARDIGYFLSGKRNWPTLSQIIDFDKARQLLELEEDASEKTSRN